MGADVVPLTPAHFSNEPQAEVIALLREVLAAAERGEIHGIALAYVAGANTGYTDWTTGRASSTHMVAAVARLHHRVMVADDG